MGHLFLDIETYLSPLDPESSLNPYKKDSKVIVIAYSYYKGFAPPKKDEIKPPVFLKEWESSEKEILRSFLSFLQNANKSDKYIRICGFNVLKFDLPYLFGRMKFHGLADENELHDLLFLPFGTDLMQLSPIISQKTLQHSQLWGISHKDACSFFSLAVKEGTGADCSSFYDKKEYGKIMKYCNEEFNFEQLLEAFYLHVTEKGTGKEAEARQRNE